MNAAAPTRRMLGNSAWLMAEHGLRFVSSVVIGLWMARQLGPQSYGWLALVLASINVFTALARAGIDVVLVPRLVADPDHAARHLRVAQRAIGWSATGSLLLLPGYALVSGAGTDVVIVAVAALIQPLAVVESLLQARLELRRLVGARIIALTVVAVLRLNLIRLQAEPMSFALTALLEPALALALIQHRAGALVNLAGTVAPPIRREEILHFYRAGWPVLLSTVALLVQTRLDQILVFRLAGEQQAGLYAAAVKFYEAWIAVPMMVSVAFLPGLVHSEHNPPERVEHNLRQLYRVLVGTSLAVSAVISIAAPWLIATLLGAAYAAAAPVLSIGIWASIFAAMGSVNARYFVATGQQRKLASRTAVAAVLCTGLNLAIIPYYGIRGCAVVTVITLLVANWVLDYADPELQRLRRLKLQAMFGLR